MKINKFLKGLLILVVVSATSITSCKKYEDGPALSFRSKKARVANEWKIEHSFEISGGVTTTSDYSGETWEFSKKGEYIKREQGNIAETGTWEFVADKEAILISRVGKDPKTYTILRLKNNEMTLKDNDEEYHLVSAY